MDENENWMRIGINGATNLSCRDKNVVAMVAFDVATNDEKKAKVVSLATVKESALLALQRFAEDKSFLQLTYSLQEGGAILLRGSPVFFLLKDSVRIIPR